LCSSGCGAMSAERATYLDSSAIVKLAVAEPESAGLRRYLRRRRPLVSSALARTEVARALLPLGESAVRRGQEVLARLELIRVSERILVAAGALLPTELRSLDAIHLATAQQLGGDLARLVTYDERLGAAAQAAGCPVAAPH
jgi:predicted nucleic acid-binding protein